MLNVWLFWDNLRDCQAFFDRLSEMIGYCERRDSRISEAMGLILKYGKFLEEISITAYGYKFIDSARMAFVTHFYRMNLGLMFMAYILDPNQKLEYLTERAIKKGKSRIAKLLLDMGNDEAIGEQLKMEFQKYFSIVKRSGQIDDLYSWRKLQDLPLLRIAGLRCAAMHASSANTERIFSALNQIITMDRNRLKIDTIIDLISVKIFSKAASKHHQQDRLRKSRKMKKIATKNARSWMMLYQTLYETSPASVTQTLLSLKA